MMMLESDLFTEYENLMNDKLYDKAYDKIHTILMITPKKEIHLKNMIKCCKKCGYWSEVAKYSKVMLQFKYEIEWSKYQLGLAYYHTKQYKNSVNILNEIKSLDKKSTKISELIEKNKQFMGEKDDKLDFNLSEEKCEIPSHLNSDNIDKEEPVMIENNEPHHTNRHSIDQSIKKYSKVVNWDKLVKDFENEEEKQLTGDAALNNFFKKLYQNSSDCTKRAMLKSFQESNGTVLSTNWNEVKQQKVEPKPPKGVEIKKMP